MAGYPIVPGSIPTTDPRIIMRNPFKPKPVKTSQWDASHSVFQGTKVQKK